MRKIQDYKPAELGPAVPEFMVTSHTANIDKLTFMSEENAIERAKELAKSCPGHTFLVFALVAEARGRIVDVGVRRVAGLIIKPTSPLSYSQIGTISIATQDLRPELEDNKMNINPCRCGFSDLIVWEEEPYDMDNIAKIECPECGSIVYGCGHDSIEDWNAHRYDDL